MRARLLVLLLVPGILLMRPVLAQAQGSAQTPRPLDNLVIDSTVGAAEARDKADRADRDIRRPPLRIDFSAVPRKTDDVLTSTHDPIAFGNRDRLWEFRSGSSYTLGKGVIARAQVIGRRGYRMPLYVSDLLGANQPSVEVAGSSLVDMSQFNVDWTAKMRIEKTFVQHKWDMRVVGELMAPLGRTDRAVVSPSTGILSSRAIRVGLVLGF